MVVQNNQPEKEEELARGLSFPFLCGLSAWEGGGGVAGFRVCLVTGNTGCQCFLSVPVCCCCELLIHHNTEAKSMRKEPESAPLNGAGWGGGWAPTRAAPGLRGTPSHHFSSKSLTMSGEAGLGGSGPEMPEHVASCHPDIRAHEPVHGVTSSRSETAAPRLRRAGKQRPSGGLKSSR